MSDDPHPFPAPGLDLNLCPLICRSTSCSNLSHQNQTFGLFLSSRGRFQGPGKDRIKAAPERDQSGPEVPDAAARPSLSAQTTRNKRQKFRRSCYEIKAWNVSPLPKVWIEEKISFVEFGSFISDKKKFAPLTLLTSPVFGNSWGRGVGGACVTRAGHQAGQGRDQGLGAEILNRPSQSHAIHPFCSDVGGSRALR